MSKNLERMGEDIRVQGGQDAGDMTDLYLNTNTGEFETKPKGSSSTGNLINVTKMTEEGFAFETNSFFDLNKDGQGFPPVPSCLPTLS